ncbi:LysR substrate-binding domain-containing protein [Geodermatophilus normandii]|uniref:LysR substrate-binding domain-containing protein n=1 Tax=Geodermatophilus normandii TaxID=1137989 RepID=UPI001952A2DB|nr:LysR substrate-binding domain-containing protein [Geodermatophilus normandii]
MTQLARDGVDRLRPAVLAVHPCGHPTRRHVDDHVDAAGLRDSDPAGVDRPGPEAGDFEDLLDLCADGCGLGFASDFAATDHLRPGVAFVGLSDVEDARTALCWRADERDPAVPAFVATVRAVADVRSS